MMGTDSRRPLRSNHLLRNHFSAIRGFRAAEENAICNVVSGSTYSSVGGSPTTTREVFVWDGTKWVLGFGLFMTQLRCQP